jgi:putative spermidine/putrescine transport system permease protein
MPGVLAGGAIVFLLSVGFWVTPALIGGPTDQLVGSFVAADVNETLNWGMAAALGTLLLAGTAACLAAAILPLRRRAA